MHDNLDSNTREANFIGGGGGGGGGGELSVAKKRIRKGILI